MQSIIKSFAGWLHCFRKPNKYFKYEQPRLRLPGSDLQYFLTESTAAHNDIPFTGKRDIDILYVNIDFEADEWH